jgi:ADP-L-glycero-D-manno-heptose 6-epimerase
MIIVTGAAGFIGSQIIAALNASGREDIIAVDDLTDGKKYINLARVRFADYLDYEDLQAALAAGSLGNIEAILHQGACSATTEWDGRYMMRVNYDYSKHLYHYCIDHAVPFIYASSAAVYGGRERFVEADETQLPLNVYGYSKWLFDQYRLRHQAKETAQVVGLRYFNVYGPHEAHKGGMASVVFHFTKQLLENGELKLFGAGEGCGPGEHRRDFVYVKDVAQVVLWLLSHPKVSGIFNLGTGKAESFNTLADHLLAAHGEGEKRYIEFPAQLKGCYQSFTEANMTALQQAGFDLPFTSLEAGVKAYYAWLLENDFAHLCLPQPA